MSISISRISNFKNDYITDLELVLNRTQTLIDQYMGSEYLKPQITVFHNPEDYWPMVYFRENLDNEYKINLGNHNSDWKRYIYQFAHEYCHIRTNYWPGGYRYSWFEESICELASHFTLIKLSYDWNKNPPYKNWEYYSEELLNYSHLNRSSYSLGNPEQLKFFIELKRSIFDEIQCPDDHDELRNDYKLIALTLLPFFENNPKLWLPLTYWNKWDLCDTDTIDEAFHKWITILPVELKSLAKTLINLM